jgi:ABC-type glycerol-3-phosphate transport system permease component
MRVHAGRRAVRLVLAWIAILCALAIFDFPIVSTFETSLKTDAQLQITPPEWIFTPTFEHYHNVFFAVGFRFGDMLVNSLIVATCASLIVACVAFPASYALVRLRVGIRRLFPFVVSMRFMPPVVFALPIYLLFQKAGLIDTRLALILVNVVFNVGFGLLFLTTYLQDLPAEIEESAMIDGAGTFALLTRIVLPLLGPAVAATSAVVFIWTWNEFLFALMLTIHSATTVTVGSSLFITAYGIKWGDISAAISVSILPTLAFTFLAQRWIVRGLTVGAVK